MKVVVVSNLKTNIIFTLTLALRGLLTLLGAMFIAQYTGSAFWSTTLVALYIACEGYMWYWGDDSDVVYLRPVEKPSDDEDQ